MSGKRHVRLWSPTRPARPERDPIHVEIMQLMERDQRSVWEKADASGLSTSTIYNWRKQKTRHPAAVSLQMAAAMLGKRITLE